MEISKEKPRLNETYQAKVQMSQVTELKYLGHMVSNSKGNMPYIIEMRKKAAIAKAKIFKLLHSIYLGKYYFESAMILFESIFRDSILYSMEPCYELSEKEIRTTEKKVFLRQIFEQDRNFPLSQLYYTAGIRPCQFEIMKWKIMYCQYILKQDRNTTISKFYFLRQKENRKYDFSTEIRNIFSYVDMKYDEKLLQLKSKQKLKYEINIRINKKTLQYFKLKRGSQGREEVYESFQLADYLSPINHSLKKDEKNLMM